jgi:hypothetical protein
VSRCLWRGFSGTRSAATRHGVSLEGSKTRSFRRVLNVDAHDLALGIPSDHTPLPEFPASPHSTPYTYRPEFAT